MGAGLGGDERRRTSRGGRKGDEVIATAREGSTGRTPAPLTYSGSTEHTSEHSYSSGKELSLARQNARSLMTTASNFKRPLQRGDLMTKRSSCGVRSGPSCFPAPFRAGRRRSTRPHEFQSRDHPPTAPSKPDHPPAAPCPNLASPAWY
jgi:hypothetical protein